VAMHGILYVFDIDFKDLFCAFYKRKTSLFTFWNIFFLLEPLFANIGSLQTLDLRNNQIEIPDLAQVPINVTSILISGNLINICEKVLHYLTFTFTKVHLGFCFLKCSLGKIIQHVFK
jgi:hypothetical protein